MAQHAIDRRTLLGGAAFAGAASLFAAAAPRAVRAEEASAPAGLVPGAYTASFPGRNGDITVTTLVSDNAIVKIEVASHTETAQFGGKALAEMPQQMVDAQSVQVDTFAGATVTSNALKAAVADCLGQAGNAGAFGEAPMPGEPCERELSCDVVVVTLLSGLMDTSICVA